MPLFDWSNRQRVIHLEKLIVHSILALERRIDKTMVDLTRLQDDVAQQKTVIGSATTLIQGLKDQIDALANSGGATTAQLDALAADIEANTAALASAVPQNTTTTAPPPGITP